MFGCKNRTCCGRFANTDPGTVKSKSLPFSISRGSQPIISCYLVKIQPLEGFPVMEMLLDVVINQHVKGLKYHQHTWIMETDQ